MNATLERRAVRAVRDYAHWHAEVDRLTVAIGGCVCPREVMTEYGPTGTSCFAEARLEEIPAGPMPDDGSKPVPLSWIAKKVVDCPECTRLCVLIAERREAKKQRGISKRRVRQVGKLVARSEEP